MSRLTLLIALAVTALFLTVKTFSVWTGGQGETGVQNTEGKTAEQGAKRYVDRPIAAKASYEPLVTRNIFSSERKEYIPEVKETQAPPPEPEPEPEPEVKEVMIQGQSILLYGVISMENYQAALVTNPIREEDERPRKWVKIGDKLANLTVDDIKPESIILRDRNLKYVILLHDEDKPKQTSSETGGVKKEARPTVVTASSPATSAAAKPPKEESDDEYEIIETPFGPVKTKKQKK